MVSCVFVFALIRCPDLICYVLQFFIIATRNIFVKTTLNSVIGDLSSSLLLKTTIPKKLLLLTPKCCIQVHVTVLIVATTFALQPICNATRVAHALRSDLNIWSCLDFKNHDLRSIGRALTPRAVPHLPTYFYMRSGFKKR
jgi:hypothetical protein